MKSLLAYGLVAGLTVSMLPQAFAQGIPDELPQGPPPQFTAQLPIGGNPGAFPVSGGPRGKMNFSNDQLEKIYNLKNQLMDDIGPKKVELKKQKRHLKDLLTQETLNKQEIQATQDKINALRNDISNLMLSFKMEFNENLTAEQRQNIRYRKMKPRRHHRGKRHHRRGMRRGQLPQTQKTVVGEALPPVQDNNLGPISESI